MRLLEGSFGFCHSLGFDFWSSSCLYGVGQAMDRKLDSLRPSSFSGRESKGSPSSQMWSSVARAFSAWPLIFFSWLLQRSTHSGLGSCVLGMQGALNIGRVYSSGGVSCSAHCVCTSSSDFAFQCCLSLPIVLLCTLSLLSVHHRMLLMMLIPHGAADTGQTCSRRQDVSGEHQCGTNVDSAAFSGRSSSGPVKCLALSKALLP